jgi:hypothetical protein
MRVVMMGLAAVSVLSIGNLEAQDAAAPQVAIAAATPSAPVTLADLVAPIALYPDQLLGQVLTISATPQEVLDLGNWLIENDTLTGSKAQDAAKEAGFSTSAQYLALFPQVVDNMAQQIDWTTQLGDAFTDKPKDVMAAIQAKRVAAEKAGNLKTSSQMTVETKKAENGTSYIAISPTDPKVIYVPVYNPVNVYVTNPTPAPATAAPTTTTTTTTTASSGVSTGAAVGIGLLSFGVGMAVGSAIHNDYYPYPMWGYGGMYYGGRPYYPPPYRPPYYPGYHPAYGYHPPSNYHWNQVNRQTNITINNNNYYNKINNNPRKPAGNNNRPGQVAGGNRPGGGGGGEYKGARPNTNDRPGAGSGRPGAGNNNRPGAGNDRPGAGNTRPAGTDRPGAGNAGASARPAVGGGGGGDRGYGGGAAASNRAAPAKAAAPANRSGGAFGSAGGGSGSSARAASDRGRASAGTPARGGGGGGGGGNRGGGGGGRKR